MLLTETNTPEVKAMVVQSASDTLGTHAPCMGDAFFEHGQWWFMFIESGKSYSVVDCEKHGETYLDVEEV